MIAHYITHHLGCPGKLGLMDNRPIAHEYPMIAIETFNTNAGFITGDHIGAAKIFNDVGFSDLKRLMGALQHIRQCTLADLDAKQINQHAFKPHK